ncbi:MAG: outer membrane beta-barrel protein [Cytophagaceae bacterium]
MGRIYSVIITLLFSLPAIKATAQTYQKGNIVVDGYLGGPNFTTGIVRLAYMTSQKFGNENPVSVTGTGPFGFKAEYLITEKIGISGNFNYANTRVSGTIRINHPDPETEETTTSTFDYAASIRRIRIMPMLNYHFGKNEKFDPYIAFGIGYNSVRLRETKYNVGGVNLPLGSYAMRGELGFRYYFIPRLGVSGQLGVGGGPLIAAGLAAKI